MFRPHFELVGASPPRWAFVLHGIFGAGKNWLSFVKKLAALRPDWGFVLPDMRGHGQSLGAPPPHDLAAVAADLVALAPDLPGPIAAVIGHSFGGKVALEYAGEQAVAQVWVLDSHPGTRADVEGSPTTKVLRVLEGLPPSFAARADFTAELQRQGIDATTASWLATSLRRDGDAYRFGLELPVVRALLEDYFRQDRWAALEARDHETHMVVAEQSFAWSDDDHRRFDAIAARAPRFAVHRIANAGHWLHVDAPDALLALLSGGLAR